MFGSNEDRRMSLLAAPRGQRGGSLLDGAPEVEAEDDAALRHARARADRAGKPASASMFSPQPTAEPSPASIWASETDAPADPVIEDDAPPQGGRSRRSVSRIVTLTVAGALVGTALAYAWPRTFVATSELLIAPGEAAAGAGGSLVDNQLRVLRSGTMLTAAAERLNLAADAEFNGAGGVLSGLGDLVAGDNNSVEQRRRQAVESLARAVEVRREGASSTVVTVAASSADPQKSALIANTISQLFVESAGREPGSSAERLAELRSAVSEAENAVEAFKAQNELVDAQGRLITDDEITRLGEQLSTARARTVELNARAASTREANVDSIVTGSLPEQYSSPSLAELRARHAAAKQQLDRVSARLGPRHPERLAAEAELEGARQEITAELRRVSSSLQTELKRAVEQEQEFASQLARMKVRQGDIGEELVRLRELERDAQLKRSAYERAMQAAQAGSGASGAASVISRAEPPLQASGPSVPVFSLAGALAGLLAGLGFGGWRRRPDEAAYSEPAEQYETEDRVPAGAAPNDTGKEAEAMYPYPPYGQQPAPEQAPPANQHAYPQPQQAPAMQYAPAQQAAPPAGMYPQPQQMAPAQPVAAAQPAWPGMHYPAPPAPAAHWQGAQPIAPMMQQPYDPWAQYRQPMPPAWPPQAYAPQPPAVVYYVPVPQPAAASAEPPAQATPRPASRQRVVEDRWRDQDAFIDESTNAAIEEIRQSLREFREAIEDFADERDRNAHRRFGT